MLQKRSKLKNFFATFANFCAFLPIKSSCLILPLSVYALQYSMNNLTVQVPSPPSTSDQEDIPHIKEKKSISYVLYAGNVKIYSMYVANIHQQAKKANVLYTDYLYQTCKEFFCRLLSDKCLLFIYVYSIHIVSTLVVY